MAPPAMSVLALTMCVVASAGLASDPPGDEGAMAHVYQSIIVMEVPLICVFMAVAVRRGLRPNLTALGAQLALLVAALAAVPILGL